MTQRNFIDKNGNSWEWNETAEVTRAVERLHETIRQNAKFHGNYQGPLYAPHPELLEKPKKEKSNEG
jgi:hypothetical protein